MRYIFYISATALLLLMGFYITITFYSEHKYGGHKKAFFISSQEANNYVLPQQLKLVTNKDSSKWAIELYNWRGTVYLWPRSSFIDWSYSDPTTYPDSTSAKKIALLYERQEKEANENTQQFKK